MARGKPFEKGADPRRNKKGRGKGKLSIPDMLRRIGEEPDALNKGQTKFETVLRKVYSEALKAEAWAVHFIAERTEGKPTQPVEISEVPPLYVRRPAKKRGLKEK